MNKRDYLNITIISLLFLLIVYIITDDIYLYGSTLDWNNQHYNFADYFRTLFYETKDIFPDFALNIGGGQNIYNFSYYGLLNPIFLISYFLPFISMQNYLIYAMIIDVISMIILMYYFIRKKHNSNVSLITTLLFISAAPLVFHSHRHIMFISYMPFLLLSLIGVDRYFDKNKKDLLIASLFLLIMTSYYFSISSIFSVILYGIYKYIKQSRKNFFKEGFKFVYPLLISVLMSCVLIVPTFYALLSGRADTTVSINFLSLFIPTIESFLYDPYTMGLSAISLVLLIGGLFRSKEYKFLSISLLLVIIFPIFTYLLNATMYVEYKVLIPLIPLVMVVISEVLTDLKVDFNKLNIIVILLIIYSFYLELDFVCLDLIISLTLLNLYNIRKLFMPILVYIILISYHELLKTNLGDELLLKDIKTNFKEADKLIDYIDVVDDSFYRTSTLVDIHKNLNRITNLDNYTLNVYSSVSSSNFNSIAFDLFNNPISYRNRAIVNSGNNYLYYNYMGVKYIISKSNISSDYELVKEINGVKLYKNPNAYSIGYVTNNVISLDDYKKLEYPYTVESILNGVVTDSKTTFSDYKIKEYKFDIDSYELENIMIDKVDDKYIINSNGGKLKIKLKKEIKDSVILIRFNNNDSNSCEIGDTKITINSISNKLTCKEWKYHNNNYAFDYVLAKDFSELIIKFSRGTYDISDIKIYKIRKSDLKKNNLGELVVTKASGDIIKGKIDVKEDGYFVLNIPYDKGFKIKVNGKEVEYEKVNELFMGFKLNSGIHDVEIEYFSPFKDIGIILSGIGILLFIIELRRCKNEKN